MGLLSDVKRSVPLSSVVSRYTQLSSSGGDKYRGCCPIHGGDNPSGFVVDDNTGLWFCYSGECGGGSVLDFAVKMGMATDVYGAAVSLAEDNGIEVPEDSLGVTDESRAQAIGLMCKLANWQLEDAPDVVARYLAERGLLQKTCSLWHLGYIHDEKEVLRELRSKGLTSAAEDVGIIVNSFGRPSIRTSKRLIMPVVHNKTTVGWSARCVDGVAPAHTSKAKYINSPDSSIYHKKRLVYGEQFLTEDISTVVVVEGNIDAIMVTKAFFDAGYDDCAAVAVCGSTLTSEQVDLIMDMCPNVEQIVLAFDNDAGGVKALKGCYWLGRIDDIDVVAPQQTVDSLLRDKKDHADIILPILDDRDALADYCSELVDNTVGLRDAIIRAVSLGDVDEAVSWVHSVWGDVDRKEREALISDVASAVNSSDPQDVVEAIGSYVPTVTLQSKQEYSGFTVPLARELLALPPHVRDMVVRRLVSDKDFCRALDLTKSDREFIMSLSDVQIVGSETSDVKVAKFMAEFATGDVRWIVVPTVARWICEHWDVEDYDVVGVQRVSNCSDVYDGAAAWLWLCGVFGM